MADHDSPDDKPLRAVPRGDGAPTGDPTHEVDPTAGLREALGSLDAKVRSPEGSTDLGRWLADVEALVAEIQSHDLDTTREEIRRMIDQLLELNAQVQNLVRLKQLLT